MNSMASSTFEDSKLVLLSSWGTTGLVLALVVAALALGLSAWGTWRGGRSVPARLLLVGLRALSVAAVLLLVLQPAIQIRNVTRVPNHVAILVDASRSMKVRERAGDPTRFQRAVAVIRRSERRLRRWREQRNVQVLGFGAEVEASGGRIESLRPDQPATKTRAALARVVQLYGNQDLAAVVLLSDGIDNGRFGTTGLSADDRKFLAGIGAPVHTVWVGSEQIKDVAIAEVFADDFAFVRNAVEVEADVLVHGLDASELAVTLRAGERVLAQQALQLREGKTRYRVAFTFVPQRVGKYVYTISTPVQAGEALEGNNRQSFVLKVIRDRIRVLQVCGRPSWDERFLRRLLKRDPNIDLISFFILRTPTDLALVPTSELSLIPFPTEELFEKELGSFDLVLLQNFNYGPYGIGTYLPHLRRFVVNGGGLAMIGGDLSFSSGGYHGTPVARVLPVRLLPPAGDPSRLVSSEDFRPRLTRQGRDHPILQLGRSSQETRQLLRALPRLTGVNLVAGPAPGATVLAEHPRLRTRRGKRMPVLAVGASGKGRALALTTDTSWHWAFLSVGQGGTRQGYDRFWRNAIRWLIKDPELKYLRVIVQRDRVRLGQPIKVTIRAYRPDYSPARGVTVHHQAGPAGGGRATERSGRTDSSGELRLELTPRQVGPLRVAARAVIGGRKTSEHALVLVEPAGPEEREPRATPALLKQLASHTSGRYLGRADRLPALEFRDPRLLKVNWRRDVELWSRWWSLLACLLLLGLDWGLRRKFGYL